MYKLDTQVLAETYIYGSSKIEGNLIVATVFLSVGREVEIYYSLSVENHMKVESICMHRSIK